MSRLQEKVALVTGASRGIGAAIARRLAGEGAAVVVNYNRNREAAAQVVEAIRQMGGTALAVGADIADLTQCQSLIEQTAATFGKLDILVNNAGIAEFLPLGEIAPDHFDHQFGINVRGLLFVTQAALPLFPAAGGRIINITSGAAQSAPPGASVYSATKAAVEALTKSHAAELGRRGITVNVVAPGITATDMLQAVIPAEVQQAMIADTALGRLGQPEDIADAVAFLASDDARWVTGQILGVNGGLR